MQRSGSSRDFDVSVEKLHITSYQQNGSILLLFYHNQTVTKLVSPLLSLVIRADLCYTVFSIVQSFSHVIHISLNLESLYQIVILPHKADTEGEYDLMSPKEFVNAFISASKSKDVPVLSDVFTEDAVYVTHNGATYRGLAQIQEYFKTLFYEGEIRAWDVKRLLDETAVEWYYEYRFNYAGSVSYDGVSLFEISNGKISLWRDFIQAAKRTYPLEVKDIELLQAAGRLETCADWIDTLSRHDERFLGAAEKLQVALDELISLLPADTMHPELQEGEDA